MSVIEFMLIPVALVIGLAFTRFLDGLWIIIDSPHRYWVHSVWIVNKVVQPIAWLWALRSLLDGGGQTDFATLVGLMGTPTFLYLQALALVGLDRSDEAMRERNWETHFFDIRVRFFALNTLSLLVTAYTTHINIAGNEQIRPAPFLVLAALNSLGIVSEDRRLHAALACTALAIMLTQVIVPIVTTIG